MKPLVRRRNTASTLTAVEASCSNCSWRSSARNGQANAARHHDATGHHVRVDVTRSIAYGDADVRATGQESLIDQISEEASR